MSMIEIASAMTEACEAQISWGSCSTHPDWGKICRNSRCATAQVVPFSSKTMARELLVPWSRARMYCFMIGLVGGVWYE